MSNNSAIYDFTEDLRTEIITGLGTVTASITFVGAGLDDLTVSGVYNGLDEKEYIVQIDGTTPDTFMWSNDDGTSWEATGVAITTAEITLEDNITLQFGAIIGHTDTNNWSFTVSGWVDNCEKSYSGFEWEEKSGDEWKLYEINLDKAPFVIIKHGTGDLDWLVTQQAGNKEIPYHNAEIHLVVLLSDLTERNVDKYFYSLKNIVLEFIRERSNCYIEGFSYTKQNDFLSCFGVMPADVVITHNQGGFRITFRIKIKEA